MSTTSPAAALIPTAAELQAMLDPLSHAQLHRLAALSEVSYFTLLKIRDGVTKDPGIERVGKFLPLIAQAVAAES